jgi:Tfp pilus assembly protein PilN
MIEINLLPGAGKKKSASRRGVDFSAMATGFGSKFRDGYLIGAIASVVIAAAAVGFLYTTQTAKAATLNERKEIAVRDSMRYANFLKDRYRAEAVRDTILRQVHIIKSLDEDRFIWAHVLDEVSRALPQYTWLTSLGVAGTPQGQNNVVATPATPVDTSSKKKNRPPKRLDTEIPRDVVQLRISGRTVDIQAMTRFWRDLEASPFLENVAIDKSEIASDQGKEVTQFQLTMNYSRPDSTQLHRVPLVLSVK